MIPDQGKPVVEIPFRLLALLLTLCAGCAAQPRSDAPVRPAHPAGAPAEAPPPRAAPPAPVNLSGYSPAFKQGYADGCATARGGATQRDEARYRSDSDYMMGWGDGNSVCRTRH